MRRINAPKAIMGLTEDTRDPWTIHWYRDPSEYGRDAHVRVVLESDYRKLMAVLRAADRLGGHRVNCQCELHEALRRFNAVPAALSTEKP